MKPLGGVDASSLVIRHSGFVICSSFWFRASDFPPPFPAFIPSSPTPMPVSAVIFDLDGLLSDTECLHCEAYRLALAEVGVALGEDEYARHWIQSGLGIADFVTRRRLPHDPLALRRRKAAVYRDLLSTSLRPMPGAVEVLERLRGVKRMAVATSAYGEDARRVLAALGIAGFFEAVVAGDDVARIKPHPDVFLLAAGRLGVPPAACVVLEDAEKGVTAARAAGMRVVAVPNRHTAGNDFSRATRVVTSLHEVDAALLDAL